MDAGLDTSALALPGSRTAQVDSTTGLGGDGIVVDSCMSRGGRDAGRAAVVDLSVIVPTFNEKANIRSLVDRLTRALGGRRADIVFVDDSTDDTPQEIAAVAAEARLPVRLIHREGASRAGGLAGAVTAGIRASRGEYVVVMDGDLQHPPEMVPLLRDAVVDADLVVASRYAEMGDASGLSSSYRRVISRGSTLLTQTCFPRRIGRVCTDPMTGFFCFRRSAVDVLRLRPRGFKILLEILARHDLRVREIPFTFGERVAGASKASCRNGLHLVYQIAGLRMGLLSRFAAVGLLGSLVNLAVMAVMVHGLFDLSYVVASVVAAEVSILHNYLLHERFVFRDRRDERRKWVVRLGQQLLFNNAEALMRLPFLILLVEALAFNSVLAQAVTLVLSFLARFLFTTRVVYPRPARSGHAPESPDTVRGTN